MGALVTIVGNVAAGKTTLARQLAESSEFVPCLEQHEDMLYQPLFSADPRKYGLPNQVDYFLFRAEQERAIRESRHIGLTDGGLDIDFHLFARLFHHKGYLDDREYELSQRLYVTLRNHLPPPDVIIYLQAPLDLLEARWRQRARQIDAEISTIKDLPVLQGFLDDYLEQVNPQSLITFDASNDVLPEELLTILQEKLGIGHQD